MHPQLTFQFERERSLSFDSFWSKDNELVVGQLVEFSANRGMELQLFLHGPTQCGKTHLLHAACQRATESGYRIAYLSASDILDHNMLSGLSDLDLVCIDDLHQLPSDNSIEIAVFELINGLRAAQKRLLLASHLAPSGLKIELPDLRTRLSWGAAYAVSPVSDEALKQVLRHRVSHSGTVIGEEIIDYLCTHFSRDLVSMLDRLRQLDQAALREKRKVTIPLVKEILRPTVDSNDTSSRL